MMLVYAYPIGGVGSSVPKVKRKKESAGGANLSALSFARNLQPTGATSSRKLQRHHRLDRIGSGVIIVRGVLWKDPLISAKWSDSHGPIAFSPPCAEFAAG
jgi:hypothetical protein